MDPDPRPIIRSQYHAALDMFSAAVEAIPDEAWDQPDDVNRSWHLAFHTLFYVHFYLQPTQDDFEPWPKQRRYYDRMGAVPWPPEDGTEVGELYERVAKTSGAELPWVGMGAAKQHAS